MPWWRREKREQKRVLRWTRELLEARQAQDRAKRTEAERATMQARRAQALAERCGLCLGAGQVLATRQRPGTGPRDWQTMPCPRCAY